MSVLVDGDPTAPICLIGMAPGREELRDGRPFVGGSGRLLWSLARRAGWGRESCYILNTIGELPEGADGNPTQTQFARYWDEFNTALARFTGRILVPLGGAALWRITGLQGGIEAWRGYLVVPADCRPIPHRRTIQSIYKTSNAKRGIKKGDPRTITVKEEALQPLPPSTEIILPILHPAGVMRSGFVTLPALAADLGRVARALDQTLAPARHTYSTYPIIAQGPLAFDIETGSGDAITRIALAHDLDTMTLEWGVAAANVARSMLSADHKHPRIAHNIAFDAPRLSGAGVPVGEPWWDTMLAAAMLQPDLYKGLNAVASLYLDVPRWKHLAESEPQRYNATDATRTLELYRVLRHELEKTQQVTLFEGTIMPAVPTLVRMSQRGLKLDTGRRSEWLLELAAIEHEANLDWHQYSTLSPLQAVRIAKWLYDDLRLPEQFNKYGGRTADDTAIKTLLALPAAEPVSPALQALLRYREVSKLRATYAETPLGDDGCVHPSYLPASKDDDSFDANGVRVRRKGLAGTWRPTAHDPNIQNQPLSARRLYVPHHPDFLFLEADYSQIELRVAATLSRDAALLEALKGDVHESTRSLLGCDRTRAKNVMYGTLYGAGPRKLAQLLRSHGITTTEAECRALQASLARAYPALWAWREQVVRDVSANYYLTNPFGLRRYFWRGGEDAPAAIDFLPQSTAAIIGWSIFRALDDAMTALGGALVAWVHDSALVEVPVEREANATVELHAIMEQEFSQVAPNFHVPIKIKHGKRGESWGEL